MITSEWEELKERTVTQLKRNILKTLFLAVLLLAQNVSAETPQSYMRAVSDAAVVSPSEVVNDLDPLTPDNNGLVWNEDKTLLKVVTWKSQSSYERYTLPYTETSPNVANVVWITLAPKVEEFCRDYMRIHPQATPKAVERRLKQRLGLHPDWQYDLFVEMWVAPEHVFRPCVDPSPTDTSCDQYFPMRPYCESTGELTGRLLRIWLKSLTFKIVFTCSLRLA
jgi:hypothetical protein